MKTTKKTSVFYSVSNTVRTLALALHPNFDTRDDCSKWVQLVGANLVQRTRLLPIGFPGKNRGMHPHRVQLLHAEVSVHPHRVQMHPALVHFGVNSNLLHISLLLFLSKKQSYQPLLSHRSQVLRHVHQIVPPY